MPVRIRSNGICPRCFSANFYQTHEPKIFHCEDCNITFELVPLEKLMELKKLEQAAAAT